MGTVVATLYKVECNFKWDEDVDSSSSWTFGSLNGARKFVEKRKDTLRWYAISGYDYIPCDENEPDGQLYLGMIYHEFEENKE